MRDSTARRHRGAVRAVLETTKAGNDRSSCRDGIGSAKGAAIIASVSNAQGSLDAKKFVRVKCAIQLRAGTEELSARCWKRRKREMVGPVAGKELGAPRARQSLPAWGNAPGRWMRNKSSALKARFKLRCAFDIIPRCLNPSARLSFTLFSAPRIANPGWTTMSARACTPTLRRSAVI